MKRHWIWSAQRSGRADLGRMSVWGGKRVRNRAELTVCVSVCYPVELTYTGIIIQRSPVLSPDSEDNLDSRGKILKQLATNLVLQCTCIQYLPPALGLFSPSLFFPSSFTSFSPSSPARSRANMFEKGGRKRQDLLVGVRQRVPKSTLSFSFGEQQIWLELSLGPWRPAARAQKPLYISCL